MLEYWRASPRCDQIGTASLVKIRAWTTANVMSNLYLSNLSKVSYTAIETSWIDWQDSHISRGNGKWICWKIPAGNGVRETAGKICKFWPNFWLQLIQNWSKIILFLGMIYCTHGTHQNLYDIGNWNTFPFLSKIFSMYNLLLAKKLGTFTEESFPAFPAGSRGKWVIFPAFPREIETAGI